MPGVRIMSKESKVFTVSQTFVSDFDLMECWVYDELGNETFHFVRQYDEESGIAFMQRCMKEVIEGTEL